jgi:hypothetical protein
MTSGALAQEEAATDKTLPIPLTMKDLSGKSNVALSVPMLPAQHDFVIAPMVSFQYAIDNLSLGLAVPMVAYFSKVEPDDDFSDLWGGNAFVLGNLTVNALYRMCTQGEWSVCFGGGLEIGASVMKADSHSKLNANWAGVLGHEDFTYNWPDSLVISPVFVVGVTNGILVGQAELGTSVLIPTMNRRGNDNQMTINFAVGGGVRILDWLIPLIELRVLDQVTDRDKYTDPLVWMSFGARLQLGGFSPMVRLSLPLTEASKFDAPVHLEVALAYQF